MVDKTCPNCGARVHPTGAAPVQCICGCIYTQIGWFDGAVAEAFGYSATVPIPLHPSMQPKILRTKEHLTLIEGGLSAGTEPTT